MRKLCQNAKTLANKISDFIQDRNSAPDDIILHYPEGVDLIPSNLELSALELSLVSAMSREVAMTGYTVVVVIQRVFFKPAVVKEYYTPPHRRTVVLRFLI